MQQSNQDKELLQALKQGSKVAFNDIFYKYSRWIFKVGVLYTRNIEDAKEIVEEVFVGLWENRSGNELQSRGVATYLYKSTINIVKEKYVKTNGQQHIQNDTTSRVGLAQKPDTMETITFGNFTLTPEGVLRYKDCEPIELTKRENAILHYLCKYPNQKVKKQDLLKDVWGSDDFFVSRSADVWITRLRKFLRVANPLVQIESKDGVAWCLVVKEEFPVSK
jgi:Response regulators consisting of a CheY-like receiver domain and a winged-helix DNA-binding domain